MGVSRCNYLIMGANIGYKELERQSEQHVENKQIGEITCLPDFISGRYFYVGIVLLADDEMENGFGVVNIDQLDMLYNLEAIKQRVKDWIWKQHELVVNPELILITHKS